MCAELRINCRSTLLPVSSSLVCWTLLATYSGLLYCLSEHRIGILSLDCGRVATSSHEIPMIHIMPGTRRCSVAESAT